MVQRAKGVGKLGIQANLIKSEKLSTSLKPSGSLHQDGKTKGGDYFKRKMKKSRSLSLDGLNSSPALRKMSLPHPGRPPPTALPPPNVVTPLRQSESQGKARHVLPNYMKSTTSSDARSQVTHLQSAPAGSVAKGSRRRCSTGSPSTRLNSGPGKYSPSSAARNLKRSSSLKLVRTLTKAPSFKPARSTSAKKCTQVVVCADSSIQKATCSSTLKETKYPEYLMLNPGGSEAEGTSIFKVCPYTYCSLNGHRHAQLPPLKHFVAARRRLLKAQKSAKFAPMSPDSFCQGSLGDKPAAIRELNFEMDVLVEIYAKSEKEGPLKIGEIICVSEDEDNCRSSPSDEGSCRSGMTEMVAYDENDDDGLKGSVNCRDAIEAGINSDSDDISRAEEESVARNLDQVYSLIMIQKERMCQSPSRCDAEGDKLCEVVEDHGCLADCTDIDWEEESYLSSELDEGEELDMTEMEDGHDEVMPNKEPYLPYLQERYDHWKVVHVQDTSESEEDQKQEEKELRACSAGLQEDGVDRASNHSNSSQVSDCLSSHQTTDVENEIVEDAAVAEIRDFVGECSQTVSEVSFEEIDGGDVTGVETTNTDQILQSEVDEAGTETSQGDACFEPQADALPRKESLGPLPSPAEETEVTAESLKYAESVILEEAGPRAEEETRATGQPSNTDIPTELRTPGTSSEDSCEADGSIGTLNFARDQENADSSLLILNTLEGSRDADNLEGFSTAELHLSEDDAGQSKNMDVNKAAGLGTTSSVVTGSTSTSTKSKDMYSRRKGKSREEPSGPRMIWRINRHEKCDLPDEELPGFNPSDPNYLPIVPDPEGEKVDLRHQMIDDRRNSEEWMIDYALQRAVSKLAPARKKKVELLVAAFEKVMPVSQFESRIKSPSTEITQGQPIQACS